MDKLIYGGDTETVEGRPLSFQFYSEDIACQDIIFVNEKTARDKFLQWCARRKRDVHHVIYFHNLQFDLIELLWGKHAKLKENGSEYDFDTGGFNIRGFYGAPTFASLRKGSHIRIDLIDSFSFYRGSLASASALYCPELPKLRRPLGLGGTRFNRTDARFVEYAMRDAQVTFHIGRAVEELHAEFSITQCVSVADMAARIFRHHYLAYTIPQPPQNVILASLDAYHGGKNNVACDTPAWYTDVYGIDVSSAYPHAMAGLPAFANRRLYRSYKCTRANRVRNVPPHGVYLTSGVAADCKWPCLFTHAFKPIQGDFRHVWIQGQELNEALRAGELKARSIRGHFYDADGDNQAPALRKFCEDFYLRKQNEKDKVRRYGYKLILNSISGKFIQTRKRTLKTYVDVDNLDVSSAAEMVAGGMFHPFIAADITAHTRARIHELEHSYAALHTATDGIFTERVPHKSVTRGDARKLGELTCDAHGELLLLRNKLYVMYDKKGETESAAFEGKRIAKYALHGFQGSVQTLERLVATGRRGYVVNRPNKLGESLKRGLTPNEFREREMTLKVGPIHVK